jgi:type I restriction enzyme S subunit
VRSPGRACYREKKTPNIGLEEARVLSLSYGQIVVKPQEKLHGLVPASFETYQIVEPGDIIIRPTDLQNDWNSLRFGLSRYRGIITSAYLCFQTRKALTREYGHLLLHAYDLKKVFYGLGSGLRQNLDWRDFKYLPCYIPPNDEQVAIVRFLDYTDRRIRRSIRAKQKLIKLLEEQKQTIIHRAVARGLDPGVRLKPSGVEWLGDIPKHWGVRRIQGVFRERNENGQPEWPVLVVSIAHGVTKGDELDDNGRPKRMIEDRALYKLAYKEDIAYNMMRMWQGAVGVVPEDGLVSPAYVVAQPLDGINSTYFTHLFRTEACKGDTASRSRGIVDDRNRLYWDGFKDLCVPVPPRDEQNTIVEVIASHASRIARLMGGVNREILVLREYRTRLIADVVTGKLDVREAAVNLSDESEDFEALEETEMVDAFEDESVDGEEAAAEELVDELG